MRLDPNLDGIIGPLANKVIEININDFRNIKLYLLFCDNLLEITSSKPENINLTISGPLMDFVAMAIKKQNLNFRETEIVIQGSLSTAEDLQQLIIELDIDWEEELSKYTGDVIAHQALYLIKQLKQYQATSSILLEEMISEYLQEESGLLPNHDEINGFMQAVDELRLQVDRLEAKVKIHESN
jgi:ubiquinone biosynthesis protein UbiJ